MDFRGNFNRKAAKIAVSAFIALSGAMAGLTHAADNPTEPADQAFKGSYTLKDDSGSKLATVEFRACAQDLCMYVKEASPIAQQKLGIPEDATDHLIASGLKSDGGSGLKDGKIVNASWKANGANVTLTPTEKGDYNITASKMMGKMTGSLQHDPAKTGLIQVASAKPFDGPKM